MGNGSTGGVISTSDLGTVGAHPLRVIHPLQVAPSTEGELNTFALDIVPVACMALTDILFEFDSSFVNPDAAQVLKDLPGLREKYKNAKGELPPLSIFGHADPVGNDTYNKQLSGRRAMAIYGLLTHDAVLWDKKLYDRPFEGDNWQNKNVAGSMKKAVGSSAPSKHEDLIKAYMELVCPFKLEKKDFLGQGANSNGKADYMGCGEFNPLVLLSADEDKNLPHEKRNKENQPNRRVVIYLFRPGDKVDANAWPCPEPLEPPAKCHDRFFVTPVKGDDRRKLGPARREHIKLKDTENDTFACRFYDRVAHVSPCEGGGIIPSVGALKLLKVDDHFAPGIELQDIVYNVTGYASVGTVKLEITSDRYADGPIFTKDLTADEITDGEHTFKWDGKANCQQGDLKDRFIHPMLSPYKVRLFDLAGSEGALNFSVLVHSIELKLGEFEKGIFDNADSTNLGHRERLKSLGYFHGPLADDANDAAFKKAVEWFQSEQDPGAPAKGVVGDSTKTKLKERLPFCVEGGDLSTSAKKKIFVSGAFFFQTDADLNPGGHPRFDAENNFWGDGLKIPIYATIYLKKKNDDKVESPKAVGPAQVFFEWIDTPDSAVLVGKQNDYVTKAIDYFKATTNPKGDNCHKDRGGKRGDDITKVFPENNDTAKFPFAVKKGTTRSAAVISTARREEGELQGKAGVIFRPSRMGGDGYRVRAYLHTRKDLDTAPEAATAPEVEIKTEEMLVWRRVRINQVLHKTNASINEMNLATVNQELAKAYMEFVGNLTKTDVDEATWNATVNAALAADADFATIGVVSYASVNTVDFMSHAAYLAAGGALGAAAYATLCRNKVQPWLNLVMQEFGKDQYHGLTLMRVANGHDAYFTNSGVAVEKTGCYVFWPKATYDAKGYVVEKYVLHEGGHCLYLRHHYTQPAAGPVATWPASDNPDDHDADDAACAMSYYQTNWHLCGQCILKLRGWDEAVLSNNDDDNKKP